MRTRAQDLSRLRLIPWLCVMLAGQPSFVAAADPVRKAESSPSETVSLPTAERVSALRGGMEALLAHLARPGARALLMVSLPGCGFCTLVRERQLGPLQMDPAYDDVPAFEISLSDRSPLPELASGFIPSDAPAPRTVAEFARALDVKVAPTVVFLDASGARAPSLVGYASDDFYWAYLSDRIALLREAPQPVPVTR